MKINYEFKKEELKMIIESLETQEQLITDDEKQWKLNMLRKQLTYLYNIKEI